MFEGIVVIWVAKLGTSMILEEEIGVDLVGSAMVGTNLTGHGRHKSDRTRRTHF